MKQRDVVVGVYIAKVNGNRVWLKITEECMNFEGRRYWKARNLEAGWEITIRSAQRLRCRVDAGQSTAAVVPDQRLADTFDGRGIAKLP
jgi:hypothetical protein